MLIKTAQVIQKVCRRDEIIARIGGDELPQTSDKDLEKLVQRITKEMKQTRIKIEELVDQVELSVSFGWATKTSPKEDFHLVLKKAEGDMYHRKLEESRITKLNTVKNLLQAFYRRFPKEKEQADKVVKICEIIGRKLDLSQEELGELKMAGMFHDIGKIILKNEIINKPGQFTTEEWTKMKHHVEGGYRILSSVNELAHLAEYVFHHHERWDGTGYPNGLIGEEIPLQSRIISIADAYSSMTTDQYFRKALKIEEVFEEIRNNAGSQFDPVLAELFAIILLHSAKKEF